ncbi:MAG TPA: hypothetical protein VKB40_01685 [Candidatus Acidoferrales bacterium]|nr:hypothetical protein [Candidatus Acidoferrales bacterium]
MAEALQKAKVRIVLVFDFIGPKDDLNALGQDLAVKFSTTLQNSSSNFTVVNRADVKKLIETNRVVASIVRNTEIAWWLATQLKWTRLFSGRYQSTGILSKSRLVPSPSKDGKSIATFSVPAPISDAMKAAWPSLWLKEETLTTPRRRPARRICPFACTARIPNFLKQPLNTTSRDQCCCSL